MCMMNKWVCCFEGRGYRHDQDTVSGRLTHFKRKSLGLLKDEKEVRDEVVVWLIGANEYWTVPKSEVEPIDVNETGDKYPDKICNRCLCLLPVEDFALNQTNKHGPIRRPTCKSCRTDIDKRPPKSSQAKKMEKNRPRKGSPFRCPICQKRSIVGVTAKIVADHDHHTGNIRDWLCDSCNTGLGRFKNGQDCLRDALQYLEDREKDWEK